MDLQRPACGQSQEHAASHLAANLLPDGTGSGGIGRNHTGRKFLKSLQVPVFVDVPAGFDSRRLHNLFN